MRKIAFLLALMMSFIGLQAQEYYINLHQSGQVIYQNNVSGINNMNIQGSPASLYINGVSTFPISAFDSITFVLQEPPQPGDAVIITTPIGSTAYNRSPIQTSMSPPMVQMSRFTQAWQVPATSLKAAPRTAR